MKEFNSENLLREFNRLPRVELEKLLKGLLWISEHLPSAILMGGTAVAFHIKEKRSLTPDLDFLVEDIENVKQLLDDQGVFYNALTNDLGITIEELNIDFIDSKVGKLKLNDLILNNFKEVEIVSFKTRIITPELLFILKMELGRERDLNDAFLLLGSGVMNRELYDSFLRVLKEYLQELEALKIYLTIL